MMRVVIVGHGVVGKNLEREIRKLRPNVYDKYKPQENVSYDPQGRDVIDLHYDIAFICVDTPLNGKYTCDITEVRRAIEEIDADIYVIKSTILPGTTAKLIVETGKKIVFSPEYYGGTQHCNNFKFNFTIVGGIKQDCLKVVQVLQHVYDARHEFHITDSKTAELTKYMENSYLATKVSFCQQFYVIAEKLGVNYEELRELFILDPRVNSSHTFVYRDKLYWSSHCLDKDVPAIAEFADARFLKGVISFNEEMKKYNSAK